MGCARRFCTFLIRFSPPGSKERNNCMSGCCATPQLVGTSQFPVAALVCKTPNTFASCALYACILQWNVSDHFLWSSSLVGTALPLALLFQFSSVRVLFS